MLSLLMCRYRALSGPIQKESRLFWPVVPKSFRLGQANVPYRRSNALSPFSTRLATFSLRRQSAIAKKRSERDALMRTRRQQALQLLQTCSTIMSTMRKTPLSNGTVCRLKKALTKPEEIPKLFEPSENHAGAAPALTTSQELVIKRHLKRLAQRGFAVDTLVLRRVVADVVPEHHRFHSRLLMAAYIRSFRARNRDITLRNYERKELVKFKGEDHLHVKTYALALQRVAAFNIRIFDIPDRYWNLDEAAVDSFYGKKTNVFGDEGTHHGGFRFAQLTRQSKHLRPVLEIAWTGMFGRG